MFFSTWLVYYWVLPNKRQESIEKEIISECAKRMLAAIFSNFYNGFATAAHVVL